MIHGLPPVTIQKTGQWPVFCIFAARQNGKYSAGPQKYLIDGPSASEAVLRSVCAPNDES
jgi:hypothetical protein